MKPKREGAVVHQVELSPAILAYVDKLRASGLYGFTPSEVIERLICERIREQLGGPLLPVPR